MSEHVQYKYLGPRQGSNYRQYFYTGRGLRAETLSRQTIGEDSRTPEEVAEDYDVPVKAVYEAIHYCTHNEELLRQEREEDLADMRAMGLLDPPHVPPDY